MTLLPINQAQLKLARARPALDLPVDILSIATANPPLRISQVDALANAAEVYPQFARLHSLFSNTGIDYRYMCQPTSWYRQPHTWEERTEVYQKHALDLLEQVALEAVDRAGLSLTDIDAFVTNTITGLAIPSLDALLMNRLDFSPNVERLPIFGLGCGGGVAGLARSARFAQGRPGRNVLFITVDLCSLCARPNDPSMAMFVAAALLFLPTVLGYGVGANLGGNLGGSVDLEGTIGQDVQHTMIDIVGILQHPQAVEHL